MSTRSRGGWLIPAAALAAWLGAVFVAPGAASADEQYVVAAVTASGDDGNVAENTIDGNLLTRWSAEGDGQWIRFDLGASRRVGEVRIAWHRGDQRRAGFDIQVSGDASAWDTLLSGQSSGTTLQLESYDLTDTDGRYVRIVGHGNTDSAWNSITEVAILGAGAGGDSWSSTADSTQAFPSGVRRIGTGNSGSLRIDFDITPAAAPINGVVGYADTSTPVTEYTDFAVAVRLSTAGYFDARDGAGYARGAELAYVAGTTYHVRITVDVPGRSYSVDVTPPGGSQVRVAEGYTFRFDSPGTNDLGQVGLKSDAPGQFRVDNHTVTTLSYGDGLPPASRVVNVSSLSGLTNALANSRAGDHIVLADGTYTNSTGSRITLRARGTFDAPIVIRPQTRGGVTVSGDGGFEIDNSSYLVLQGFDFRHGAVGEEGMLIGSSDHIRISRNHFELDNDLGDGDSGAKWIYVDGGTKIRIDHNRFQNKTTDDPLVAVAAGPDGAFATYTLVDRNHFRSIDDTDGKDGDRHNHGEALRVGNSDDQDQSGYAVVQYNLFEDCAGDAEVISNKTSDNIYRHNTLRGNYGSLVLRHGDRAVVDGNYFLDNEGGLRMYGDDNVVVGNYFEGNTGSGVRSTLMINSGTVEADGPYDGAGYDQPNGGVVAFNTLVNNTYHLVIGDGSGSLAPRDMRIGNNILVGSSGDLVHYALSPSGFSWEGNILHGTDPGDIPSGYRTVDPRLGEGTDSVYRLTSGSEAIDAAANFGSYPMVNTDLDGHARSGAMDVGADEFSSASPLRRPLLTGDVGPAAT